MYRHYIFVFSDYNSGKRIGYHIEEDNSQKFLIEAKKMKDELKTKYTNAKYGIYFLTTKDSGWNAVKEYDGFYEDIQVVGKKKFFDSIEKNYFLKEKEEENIKNADSYNEKDFLGKISLISRKENLQDDLLQNMENLKDIDKLKEDLEKELIQLREKLSEVKKISKLIKKDEKQDTPLNRHIDFEINLLNKELDEIKGKKLHQLYNLKVSIKKMKLELKKIGDKNFLQKLNKIKNEIKI
ncbi:hypothetical protein [uncultured Cetobacterium sp.]|uniref:hypothetical protein n=1 Tax=Cetobacterium sp. TaxID=2071632 RepID=UPI0025E3FCBD|nr:hypothetical protein [uncultured Cetobacterium sp.]